MKKIIYTLLILYSFLVCSCDQTDDDNIYLQIKQDLFANGKDVKEDDLFYAIFDNISENNYQVLDAKGYAINIDAPKWFSSLKNENELKKLYDDKLILIYKDSGKDLRYISKNVNSVKINKIFYEYISKELKKYLNNIPNNINFTGLKKEGDWWELKNIDGKDDYEYTVLYVMDKELFNRQLKDIIDNQ